MARSIDSVLSTTGRHWKDLAKKVIQLDFLFRSITLTVNEKQTIEGRVHGISMEAGRPSRGPGGNDKER